MQRAAASPSMPRAEELNESTLDTRVSRLQRTSSPDMILTIGLVFIWSFLTGIITRTVGSTETLSLAIRPVDWQLHEALGPGLVCAFILFSYWFRFTRSADARNAEANARLSRFIPLIFVLSLVRVATLWSPVLDLFPILALLWTPHASWSLPLTLCAYIHWPQTDHSSLLSEKKEAIQDRHNARSTAILLFFICLTFYGCYALYFCQVTMLHGDEGQYLRVTQSLLHDGDMDLANNIDREQTNEFHVREFPVHKAPASPTGKIHSVHPIGLSVALVPAYWIGLELWQNPRLGAALFIAVLSSACIALIFIWLRRLHLPYVAALTATLITACTCPFFTFTNQLFPEIPALFICLVTLSVLAHWQQPKASYKPLVRRMEVLTLLTLAVLLACLPFLHARYTPLGLLCGIALVAQAWSAPHRKRTMGAIGVVVFLALLALLSFHFAFSGDWMGPFRPGNAWGKDALSVSTWSISLAGHWLHVGKGLLNSSPIFLFSFVGWWALARQRDHRIFYVAFYYLATAAVHGLHPEWGFGFCYPARFLVTALPVLVYGIAVALTILHQRPLPLFLFFTALSISLESVWQIAALPELGYNGNALLGRTVNDFYPLGLHFFNGFPSVVPLFDALFWILLIGALGLWTLSVDKLSSKRSWALGLFMALLPTVWGQTQTASTRLDRYALSPHVPIKISGSVDRANTFAYQLPLQAAGLLSVDGKGQFRTVAGKTPASVVGTGRLLVPKFNAAPQPGLYTLTFPSLSVHDVTDQIVGHIILTSRQSLVASTPWETRTSHPLTSKEGPPEHISFIVNQPEIRSIFIEYSGRGTLSADKVGIRYTPLRPMPAYREEIHHRKNALEQTESKMALGLTWPQLPEGHYTISYQLKGASFLSTVRRDIVPALVAVYAPSPRRGITRQLVESWFTQDRVTFTTISDPAYYRPLAEAIFPPWQVAWPIGDGHFELSFYQPTLQDIHLLFRYDGEQALAVESISIYRDTYEKI